MNFLEISACNDIEFGFLEFSGGFKQEFPDFKTDFVANGAGNFVANSAGNFVANSAGTYAGCGGPDAARHWRRKPEPGAAGWPGAFSV